LRDKRLLITCFSGTGRTWMMAEEIGKGAQRPGLKVEVRRVEECSLDGLAQADGIVVGSPTYFSNVAWQVKKLIDDSIALYRRSRQLRGKVAGCFTSSGTQRDAKDCIRMLELAFGFHHKMRMIPGIARIDGDPDELVSETCRQYGAEIGRQMLTF